MTTATGDGDGAADPLRKSAQFSPDGAGYQALLEILPDAVFTLDPAQRVRFITPAAADLLGVQPDDVVGLTCEELLRCADCGPSCAVYETRTSQCTRRAFPREIHRRDGTEPSVLIDAVPLGRGYVAVVIHDVTEPVGAAGHDERIREALKRTGGCVTRAARLLNIHRTTLWRQMRQIGVRREEFLLG